MSNFQACIDEELKRQRKILLECEKQLADAPQGYLKVRNRKKGKAYYACGLNCEKNIEHLISTDIKQIRRLFEKKINSETIWRARMNIQLLEDLQKGYCANDYLDLVSVLPKGYSEAAKLLGMEKNMDPESRRPIQRCYDPERHIHETVCGLLVRSKSEVIIVNSITNYEIPVDYERKFPYPDSRGIYFRPDFTFDLPNGRTIIWEHLGLLKLTEYSEHTVHKLMTYQKYGYLIGRNLILTQDDEMGNCSSLFIDEIIRTKLLPYYK